MKGILFKPDMIRAIVEGRKTVTRRFIKFKPFPNIIDSDWHAPWFDNVTNEWVFTARFGLAARSQRIKSRYQVGEVVYIKEAWRITSISDDFEELLINYGDGFENWKEVPDDLAMYYYNHYFKAKRRPHTLFMPAWAARYFIKIKDVRAERTRDITPVDCLLEGIIFAGGCYWTAEDGIAFDTPQEAYFALYDSINGKGAHENNWDWRYEFELIREERNDSTVQD